MTIFTFISDGSFISLSNMVQAVIKLEDNIRKTEENFLLCTLKVDSKNFVKCQKSTNKLDIVQYSRFFREVANPSGR